jgi:hypothetical protein
MFAFGLETKSAIPAPEVLSLEVLGDARQREKLSGSAIRLFMTLADVWKLTVDQRCRLLGDISKPTYHNWQRGKVGTLSRDQIERISLLLGIHKGLKLLFADDVAGMRWLTSANTDLPFGGKSPLERALCGSINDLTALRRYIDAWRGVK